MLKSEDLPCLKCPVLAICVTREFIDCPIILKFLNDYQLKSEWPEWSNMLSLLREILRGHWYTVGYNDDVIFLEKDRKETLVEWIRNY